MRSPRRVGQKDHAPFRAPQLFEASHRFGIDRSALMEDAPALGIGWLYAVRGLGTGVGPIATRVYIPDRRLWPAMMGIGIVITGILYIALGSIAWTWWVLIPVFVAHTTSGANWVTSTVLLQERAEDRAMGHGA